MRTSRFYLPWLGRVVTLTVTRFGPPGAFLSNAELDSNGDLPTILLPGNEVPRDAHEGDTLDVFVYLDSEDRPVATLRPPRIERGEVAFLRVTDTTRFGAFVDWGMPKELLVPRAEQTVNLHRGDRHPVGLYLDDSGRLAGTMRVAEMLAVPRGLDPDTWVHGEAWRWEPRIGLFVIVERKYVGLLPAQEPHTLSRGDAADFRVATVLQDGKVTLSLRGHAADERERDAQRILDTLAQDRRLRVCDRSSPEEIRTFFGLSKKAFKRAVGLLLKQRRVRFDDQGFLSIPLSRGAPGAGPT